MGTCIGIIGELYLSQQAENPEPANPHISAALQSLESSFTRNGHNLPAVIQEAANWMAKSACQPAGKQRLQKPDDSAESRVIKNGLRSDNSGRTRFDAVQPETYADLYREHS